MKRIFMSTIPSQDHFEKLLLSESFIKIIFLCLWNTMKDFIQVPVV